MENILMLHYNFMSHVCHVRRANFSFHLLHRVHSCKAVTTWDFSTSMYHIWTKHQTPR
jgi:hypothetical protein